MKRVKGFTLIELLVVIAIIAMPIRETWKIGICVQSGHEQLLRASNKKSTDVCFYTINAIFVHYVRGSKG